MTIDKAIKGLESRLTPRSVIQFGELDDDLKLGIEALRRIRASRTVGYNPINRVLPGETEE